MYYIITSLTNCVLCCNILVFELKWFTIITCPILSRRHSSGYFQPHLKWERRNIVGASHSSVHHTWWWTKQLTGWWIACLCTDGTSPLHWAFQQCLVVFFHNSSLFAVQSKNKTYQTTHCTQYRHYTHDYCTLHNWGVHVSMRLPCKVFMDILACVLSSAYMNNCSFKNDRAGHCIKLPESQDHYVGAGLCTFLIGFSC